MAGILTQEEVDALLSAVSLGEVVPILGGDAPTARRVELWDAEHPRGGQELKGLDLVHDSFADAASASLTGLMSLPVVVARHAVSRQRFGEFAPTLPQPSMIYQVRLAADGPEILIQLGAGTVLAMIERLFGGPVVSGVTERPLTTIERSVLRRVMEKLLLDLARSWSRFRVFEPVVSNVESHPELLRFVAETEPLSVTTFEMRLAETAGFITVAYPEAYLQSVFLLPEEPAGPAEPDPAHTGSRDSLGRRLEQTRVPVVVHLGTTKLRFRELAGLKSGDVIPLDSPIEGDLIVQVGGIPKFLARPGQRGQRLAISIVGRCPESDDDGAGRSASSR